MGANIQPLDDHILQIYCDKITSNYCLNLCHGLFQFRREDIYLQEIGFMIDVTYHVLNKKKKKKNTKKRDHGALVYAFTIVNMQEIEFFFFFF